MAEREGIRTPGWLPTATSKPAAALSQRRPLRIVLLIGRRNSSGDEFRVLLIHDITAHQQTHSERVRDRLQRAQRVFPQISLNQFAAKSLLIIRNTFLF